MKKLVRLVISILVLAGLASGGYWFYTSRVASAASPAGDGTYTQIVKGLNPGDKVIVPLDTSSSNSSNSRYGGGAGNLPAMPSGGVRP